MDVFSALADPTRRDILQMLAENSQLSATDISDKFHISPPAVSQHLKILRETHLVTVEKRAQMRLYQLNTDALLELDGWARNLVRMWQDRFRALDTILENLKQQQSDPKSKKKGKTK